ncbi:MAG: hypothetical protein EOO03_02290, partial [Chitinophagaceae bacterium]
MRLSLCCLAVLFSCSAFCQVNRSDHFRVKTTFEIGESQTYEVKEFSKVDHIFLGIRSSTESLVRFEVLDTANGGYMLRYVVLSNTAKKEQDSTAQLMTTLTKGLEQYFFVKGNLLQPDSISLELNRLRISASLDSIMANQSSGKNMSQYMISLKANLDNGEGMGPFLRPLLLFYMYLDANLYKKFATESKVNFGRLLGKNSFTGLINSKWSSTSGDGTVKLRRNFTGDPTPTARYFKPYYEAV